MAVNLYNQRFFSIKNRFMQKCDPVPWSGCWIWTGRTDNRLGKLEYGQFWLSGKNVPAHRASWVLHNGPIPNGLLVCHKCDVPCCVNPDHLFLGTHKDNTADMATKKRNDPMIATRRGSSNNFSKLSESNVLAIVADNRTQRIVALEYGISQTCVSLIKRKKNWKHIHE